MKNLLFLCLFVHSVVNADVALAQKNEIDHLLTYIRTSDCVLNRNGTDYPADKAVAHVERKYKHFIEDIKTTEDFIEYSATKSTMSGKYYMVSCKKNNAIKVKDWLLMELHSFRLKK